MKEEFAEMHSVITSIEGNDITRMLIIFLYLLIVIFIAGVISHIVNIKKGNARRKIMTEFSELMQNEFVERANTFMSAHTYGYYINAQTAVVKDKKNKKIFRILTPVSIVMQYGIALVHFVDGNGTLYATENGVNGYPEFKFVDKYGNDVPIERSAKYPEASVEEINYIINKYSVHTQKVTDGSINAYYLGPSVKVDESAIKVFNEMKSKGMPVVYNTDIETLCNDIYALNLENKKNETFIIEQDNAKNILMYLQNNTYAYTGRDAAYEFDETTSNF